MQRTRSCLATKIVQNEENSKTCISRLGCAILHRVRTSAKGFGRIGLSFLCSDKHGIMNNLPSRIRGTGEMAALIREFDWTTTQLGPIDDWPDSLVGAVNMILSAPMPMQIFWGPEMIVFYNDALTPSFAEKHPGALGGLGREVWADAWPFVGSQLEDVFEQGVSHYVKDVVIPLVRGGVLIDTCWDYSYSPLFRADGSIAGVLDVAQDRTEEALAGKARRESEEHLNLAMESAELGMWFYDPATGIVVADDRMHRIFRLSTKIWVCHLLVGPPSSRGQRKGRAAFPRVAARETPL